MTSTVPLKRLGSVTLGKMVQPERKAETDVVAPYLRAAHVQPQGRIIDLPEQPMWFTKSELKSLDLRQGDVVVVEGGAGYGRSAVIERDMPGWGFQNSIIRVRPFAGIADGRYLDYALQEALVRGRIDLVTSTATLPHFTADKVSKFELPSLPEPKQRAIADYLDHETAQIDALVEKQGELIRRLVERRLAVITRTALRGLQREQGGSHDVSRWGSSLAVEPWLSKMPVSWGLVRFKTVCLPREERNMAGTEVMLSLTVKGQLIHRSAMAVQQNPSDVSIPRYFVARPGDLVVNPMWLIGGAIGVSDKRGAVSPDYRVFEISDVLDPWYLHAVLRSAPYFDQYKLYTRSNTTFDRRIKQNDLDNLPLPVPPIEVQRAIVEYVRQQIAGIDALIAKAAEHIALAKERRSALITAAITGQIDVPAAAQKEV